VKTNEKRLDGFDSALQSVLQVDHNSITWNESKDREEERANEENLIRQQLKDLLESGVYSEEDNAVKSLMSDLQGMSTPRR
jgi:negative regulator of replication initiation